MNEEGKAEISYALVNGDWEYIHNDEGIDFRYDTLKEAKEEIPNVSAETEYPEQEIIILKETRKVVGRVL